ncbi:MFS transporter [Bacillus taeanensis]|uniref:MFS transporter n=1 Tax=Bacillus taeanensis TaxID=273032 RepID=A0A366XZ81_9BACI|nr:MFS transporter [Bacillus taeanensis]RBW70079.1 MFS transporter [Bacillus taeanensis]
MSKEALWTKEFLLITFCNLFLFIAFYYLVVTLPIYALQELNGSEAEAGLLITSFLIAAIIIRPLAGKWTITFGNRLVLFIGLFLFLVCSSLYFLPETVLGMMLVRLLHGIGFGIATTAAGGIAANVIPPSRKGEGMGYYALAFNLAVVLGPFLGLTALHKGNKVLLFGIVILCSLIALVIGLLLSNTKGSASLSTSNDKERRKFDIVEKSAVRIAVVASFFAILYSSILSFVPVYAEDIGLLQVSSYFFVVYAAVMLLSRPLTGRWLDRYGENAIVYPSIFLFAIGMFLLSSSNSVVIFLLAAALIGLGWGTLFPTFQTIAVQKVTPERSGLAISTFLSIFDLGIGIGTFLVGIVMTQMSLQSLYFYSSFIVLFGIGLYNFLHGHHRGAVKGAVYERRTHSG